MNNKFTTIFIALFVSFIVFLGMVYFVNLFKSKDSKIVSLNTFKSQKETFLNKKQAYDAYLRDSTINIRKENVSINLSALFKSKSQTKASEELISLPLQTNQNKAEFSKKDLKIAEQSKEKPRKISNQQPESNRTEKDLKQSKTRESFFSSISNKSESVKEKPEENNTFIEAVIHSKQTIYQGSTVKLRIISQCVLSGITVPMNTFLYGIASFQSERVMISIHSINMSEKPISVNLEVFDKDGMPGIPVPYLAIHDASKQAVDDVVSQASKLNVPYLGNTIRNTISNQNNKESVILTDGYQVLLKQ